MCGIVGYTGKRQAQGVLYDCLCRLEYRGYDSCGIAVNTPEVQVFKDAGKVHDILQNAPLFKGTAGLGHTRWATCGEPTQINAHPHTDCTGKICLVHNGVINNYSQLLKRLEGNGHKIVSDTDTELIAHLIEEYDKGDLEEAVRLAVKEIEGSYALVVMRSGENTLVVVRQGSPLVIGVGDGEYLVASDVPAILGYTNRVIYLDEGDIGTISPDSLKIRRNGGYIVPLVEKVNWTQDESQKAGYSHYMLKEIHEQPRVIQNTLINMPLPESFNKSEILEQSRKTGILFLACGSSYHAALTARYLVEEHLNIPVRLEVASEFNYMHRLLPCKLAVVLTQSGETADVLRAMRRLKQAGCMVVAITNVAGSTAARLADHTIYTQAGPEIGVAATKSFIAQLIVLYALCFAGASAANIRYQDYLSTMRLLPSVVQSILGSHQNIKDAAVEVAKSKSAFFIGRGINYPIALEGALKLKEISYIHAEGYAAGELKHGPFALLSPETPVLALVSRDQTYEAMLTGLREIKVRRAPLIVIGEAGDEQLGQLADRVISLPSFNRLFNPILFTVVLQLLAYYVALELGCSIDTPRNLAKSVTVE
ncbi:MULTISPECIES: glutamine--fructose-6-phosphate transaminase (isomerizing) [Dehalococcoides]|uniref:glutamine--fructose-6-phosphate transaminase (isomerizing) n=1 Tax=Dehalococcoides TaxID=61434 RepID=UPI0002B76E6C|nr:MULTISPECIES: glutamine--fructose-6-phosphate transaminase (isomerizing) [Dehalococcoides]AGG06168.1 glucosamine--fructose-6-phosphate aminotransferase (isomerizing) [Dehalococcoides mccartyi DCMB5]AQU05617.1 glutamine--fructose-6-phosphate aminotransferase [Dehalococcoides mccartyi]AQU07063.1 glutamine--fructose-6-phosphate aminotransferase [Dehalococcoides mccartyi]